MAIFTVQRRICWACWKYEHFTHVGATVFVLMKVVLTGGKGSGAASGAGNATHVVRCWDLADCQAHVQYSGECVASMGNMWYAAHVVRCWDLAYSQALVQYSI